jgi:hypothetical protein
MGNPLAELGLGTDDGKITIDHVLTLSLRNPNINTTTTSVNTDSAGNGSTSFDLEQSIRKALDAVTQSSLDMNRTFRIVGYALASYFVLSGVARVIEAFRTKTIRPSNDE